MPKLIGTRLNQVLNKHGINKTAFAKDLKVHRNTLHAYLNGRCWPGHVVLGRMLRLLEPFGVTINDILPEGKTPKERL